MSRKRTTEASNSRAPASFLPDWVIGAATLHLLDVNVLVSLLWPRHVTHKLAIDWFASLNGAPWATCVLSQAGFVRLSSQSASPGSPNDPSLAAQVLRVATDAGEHTYLPIDFDFSVVNALCTGGVVGHRQVTDAWLLATAMRNNAKFVTFDKAVRHLLSTESERIKHLVILDV